MLLQIMHQVALLLAAAAGGAGVFLLWASFYVPDCTLIAVFLLVAAAAITLAMPQRK